MKEGLLLGGYGSLLDGQALFVVLDVTLEAGDVLGSRSDGNAGVACEDYVLEIVGERLAVLVDEIAGQQGDTPGTTFTSSLHDGDGRVEGGSQHALTYAGSLEVAAVTGDAVHANHLVLEQDVVTDLQHADGTIEVGAHEVGEVELVVGRANEEGTTVSETGNRLAADIVEGHQATAVGIALKGLVEQFAVELVHVDGNAQQLLILLEQSNPGVDVAGAVVAMNHSHERTVGRGHHVNHLVRLAQRLLQHNHGEGRGACANVTCALLYGVGGYHAGACVALGRTNGTAGFQMTGNVEFLGTLGGQHACTLAGVQRLGQDIEQGPRVALRSDELVELLDHRGVVGLGGGVNRNHT